jgi:hypothetical protein
MAALIEALTDIGVVPVIALSATLAAASLLYRRFRR